MTVDVAVTGVGVVAPCGVGKADFWNGLLATPTAGDRRVPDWDPTPWFDNAKAVRRADLFTQYALGAAAMALEDAGELDIDPHRFGVMVGTGIGGIGTNEEQIVIRHERGSRRVSPFLIPMMMPNAAGASISMRHGLQGPCESIVTACAAGTHSIGAAAHRIRHGICDAVLAGGSEAPFTPTSVAGFANMTALSNSGESRPFDVRRDGFVMSEGSAVLVLERYDLAVARGAKIYGSILGSASTADAHHITAPTPGGEGAEYCIRTALADAGVSTQDVKHVNAHGTSTPLNDAAEAAALAAVFGTDDGPAITSTKGVTGHALGAAGALEAAAVLMAFEEKSIPPTAGLEQIDPDIPALDFVTEARPWTPGVTISNSFGFGGHNGTIVIGPA